MDQIRIASLNINGGWHDKQAKLVETLEVLRIQVLCIQETNIKKPTSWHQNFLDKQGWKVIFTPQIEDNVQDSLKGNKLGLAIIVHSEVFNMVKTVENNKDWQCVEIFSNEYPSFLLVNMHIKPYSRHKRATYFLQIKQQILNPLKQQKKQIMLTEILMNIWT